jgi:ABC-type transport system involved in cytochrome bd biosynthesis fused ATPase/permease subunit
MPLCPVAPSSFRYTYSETTIKIEHASFSYKKATILKSFSIIVREGEFIAIIGKLIVGKLTLLTLITRLRDLNTGYIKLYR